MAGIIWKGDSLEDKRQINENISKFIEEHPF